MMSKRQQARNERALQDLVSSVPGNNKCADCQSNNPGWASWSLGIFLCMRCAAIHRKLGTHISKVKSLSMDSWTNEQVEGMKKNGNVASNRRYNPQNVKPPVPLDVDEVDSAMERFLRQKYDSRALQGNNYKPTSRQNTGSSSSEEPPPLPPKPTNRFGSSARAASSTYPLSPQPIENRNSPVSNSRPYDSPGALSSPKTYGRSSIEGWSGGTGESFESKMATLKDMGFTDQKKNATVLKGLDGNLEKAIESLVRLRGGSAPASQSRTPLSTTPNVFSSPLLSTAPTAQGAGMSTNPFDQLDSGSQFPSTPQVMVTQGATINQNQALATNNLNGFNTHNPFLHSAQSQSITQSMQNLNVTQPLFPHATGGFPMASQSGTVPYQPVMTPPLPSLPQQQVYSRDYNQSFQMNASSMGLNPYMPSTNFPGANFVPVQPSDQLQQAVPNPIHHSSTFPLPNPSTQSIGRADKSTIMALYNYPHLAPTPAQPPEQSSIPLDTASSGASAATLPSAPPSRSFSTPALPSVGSRNPFKTESVASAANGLGLVSADASAKYRHVSKESVDVGGFGSGRHSPDAFASLSARYGR